LKKKKKLTGRDDGTGERRIHNWFSGNDMKKKVWRGGKIRRKAKLRDALKRKK